MNHTDKLRAWHTYSYKWSYFDAHCEYIPRLSLANLYKLWAASCSLYAYLESEVRKSHIFFGRRLWKININTVLLLYTIKNENLGLVFGITRVLKLCRAQKPHWVNTNVPVHVFVMGTYRIYWKQIRLGQKSTLQMILYLSMPISSVCRVHFQSPCEACVSH